MNAYDVAKPLGSPGSDTAFAFGIDDAKLAANLHALANAIEAGATIVPSDDFGRSRTRVERIAWETIASREDFTLTVITITLAERVRVPNLDTPTP